MTREEALPSPLYLPIVLPISDSLSFFSELNITLTVFKKAQWNGPFIHRMAVVRP